MQTEPNQIIRLLHFEVKRERENTRAFSHHLFVCWEINVHSSLLCHIPRIRLQPPFFVFLSHNTTSFYAKQNKTKQTISNELPLFYRMVFLVVTIHSAHLFFIVRTLCMGFRTSFCFSSQSHTHARTNSVTFLVS